MRENWEKLIAATTFFGAKKKLNTRVLHSRDFLKVAAFSISQRGFGLLRRLDALFAERAQEQHMMR
jgi:hypothetical protein